MTIIVGATDDNKIGGLAAAMTAMGLDVRLWFPPKPAYDMMIETKPEYVVLSSQHMTQEVIEAVREFKPKIIVYGVNIPEALEKYVKLILISDTIPKTIADNIVGNTLVLHKAANLAQYRQGHFRADMESDICHISSYESAPSSDVMRQMGGLIPLLPHNFKVCGPVKLPCAEYLGRLKQEDIMSFLRSTKVNIDYDNTLMLDCAANKIFTLSNHPNPLFPSFKNDTELVKLLEDFVPSEKARRNVCKKAYKHVINKHTYFQRVVEIAENLGETAWADLADQTYRKLRD